MNWNDTVAASPYCSLFQTSHWADRLEHIWDCERIELPLSTIQLLLFSVNPKTYRLSRKRWLLESVLRERWYQWFGLPISTTDEPNYVELFSSLDQIGRGVARIMPSPMPIEAEPYVPSNWTKERYSTLIVDLRKSEKELWDGLKKTGRKAVRYAQEKDVAVHRVQTLEQMLRYCDTVRAWGQERYGKRVRREDFMSAWSLFHEVDGCVFETFIASLQGEPVASLSVWGFNGYVSELGSFQSDRNVNEHLFGADAIKWEVIRWSASRGFNEFDLTGMRDNANVKELAIRQFKEKWGGREVPYLMVYRRHTET